MANDFGGVKVVPNPHAPDVLADEALGFEIVNDTVRITFAVAKMLEGAPPSEVGLVTLGRLVMGKDGAQRLAVGLFNFLTERGVTLDVAQSPSSATN